MARPRFAAWHRHDRAFVLTFVISAWAAVLIGFYPAVSQRWRGEADYAAPLILQVHVFAFAGWLCLLSLQVILIRMGRAQWHRTLGVAGAVMIPVLVVTGLGAEVFSQRFYSPQDPANLSFFVVPVYSMAAFAAASTAAILLRADSPAHKRLMMVATATILVAAFNRWWGYPIYSLLGDEYFGTLVRNFLGPDLLLLALVAYDLATRRRVHRGLAIAVPLIVAGQLIVVGIYHSDWWPAVARGLVGI